MNEEIFLIDFLEIDEVLEMLKEQAKKEYPDKKFIPFWKLYLRGNELIIKSTVSDGKIGEQEQVELSKIIKNNAS
ncbi:hypothetical protein C4577_05170 [Candidatus Parcubacteria bacterium]|nr:MAG: hypothetical protein C4577_05170 [Candidatus Parcubacteria bacterium]